MTKQKRSFEECLPFLFAFAIPVLVMVAIFIAEGFWPLGNRCFLRTDLYHQYVAFFQNLGERLGEGKSLLYAFEIGLGSNYSALYAYYLCGPLHLLALLFTKGYIIEFITFFIVTDIGLCGFTMAWYLSKRFKTNHIGITVCGICYALSGYMAAYSWNIMWLDVLVLAPVVLYGVEKLVTDDDPQLYGISLALAILCNYYISIMLCIFLVFYFLTRLIAREKLGLYGILKRICMFALYSLLAGAMAAVLVLPAAYALSGTASSGSSFPSKVENYFSIIEMLSRHLMTVEVETGLDHWPNLYSGVFVFLCIPFYYMNREVSSREKIANSCLLAFLLLSFNTNVLNFIWHGLHYPNSLPCRQSFLYTFVLMVMCFEGIRAIPKLTRGKLLGTMWGSILLILIMEKLVATEQVVWYAFYGSIAFIALYTMTAFLYKSRRLGRFGTIALCLCLLSAEMCINTAATSVSSVNRTDFLRYDESYDTLIEIAEASATEANAGFTRMERQHNRSKNDGPFLGYSSASLFSSTTYSKISTLYKKLGLEGNTNAYCYTGATPLVSSMLSVQYLFTESPLPESPLYTLVTTANDSYNKPTYLYEYNYTLPLGYLVPFDTNALWSYTAGNASKVQNSFVNVTTGVSNVLNTATSSVSGAALTATAEEDGWYFVSVGSSSVKEATATVGDSSYTWKNLNRGYLIDLGWCTKGQSISVTAKDVSSMSATLYRFEETSFIEAYTILSQNPWTITDWTDRTFDTHITGTVTAEQESTLMISLPFDKGWSATVDGEEVTIYPMADALLGIDIPAGTHEVTISYLPEGLLLGAALSAGGLLVYLLLLIVTLLHKRKSGSSAETVSLPDRLLPAGMGAGEAAADASEGAEKAADEAAAPEEPAEETAPEAELPEEHAEENAPEEPAEEPFPEDELPGEPAREETESFLRRPLPEHRSPAAPSAEPFPDFVVREQPERTSSRQAGAVPSITFVEELGEDAVFRTRSAGESRKRIEEL